ncbi:MAG: translation elongation factor Ts [Pseudobdellovibrionaceae bacterium]
MSISATLVKELRENTNAGMMDWKRALAENNGDFEAAIEWLRVKGLSSAAKKSDRIAAEGAVSAFLSEKVGVLVEINSETDFVARNDNFRNFVKDIAEHVANSSSTENLLDQAFNKNPAVKIGEYLKENIAKIGENIVLRRQERYPMAANTVVQTYIHGEGKIGVMIEIVGAGISQETKTLATDICLHIAAMNPMAISSEQIPGDVVAKEREILKAKNLEAGKKAEMIDKIVDGQIRKFLAENCLLDQQFVKNPDLKVSDYVIQVGKKIGATLTVKRFVRFELGEGIEKKQTDFAAEVAAQVKGH